MALRRTHLLMFLSAFLLFAFLLPLFRGAGGSPFGKASEAAADVDDSVHFICPPGYLILASS